VFQPDGWRTWRSNCSNSRLDTRSKILTAEEALRKFPGAVYATAYFDPMLAGNAQRIAELVDGGRTVVVVITDPPEPILPARSRAELAASLRNTAAVVIGTSGLDPAKLVSLEAQDIESRDGLTAHVHRRHGA